MGSGGVGGFFGGHLANAGCDVAFIARGPHLAATPTAHWLEYVDWMNPLLTEPLAIVDGMAVVPDRPGLGLAWNDDIVRRYAGA